MAIKLENKPNVEAPSATYPYGRTRDKNGATAGTPLNTETHGDFHQFFAKMLAESGIVANGLPDNATNGFQYFEALKNIANIEIAKPISFVAPTVDAGWEAYGVNQINTIQYGKKGGIVVLRGAVKRTTGGTNVIFSLPVGFRPATYVYKPVAGLTTSNTYSTKNISIGTAGDVRIDSLTSIATDEILLLDLVFAY